MLSLTRNVIKNRLKQIYLLIIVFVCLSLAPYSQAGQEKVTESTVDLSALRAKDVPIMQAIKDGDKEKVQRLIKQGADVNLKVFNDLTPLHSAVTENKIDIARLLIKDGADVNARMLHTITPMYIAAERGNLDMIKVLVNAGAKIGIFEAMAATQYGHLDILGFFKNQGLDLTRTYKGATLLHVAAAAGNAETVEWLIDNGVPVNVVDEGGQTPLNIAVGNTAVEEVLKRHGAKAGAIQDFESLSQSAGIALERKRYHEAATKYELVLATLDPKMQLYESYKLLTLFYLTYAYLGDRELIKAKKTAQEYINTFKPEDKISKQNLVVMHGVLAELDLEDGDHEGAINHMTTITRIYERTSPPGAPILAKAYFDLGAVYNGLKQEGNAEVAFKNALRVYRKNKNPDITQLSEIELNVGQVLRNEGKYKEAKEVFLNVRNRLSNIEGNERDKMILNGAIYGLAFIAKEEGHYEEANKLYTIEKQYVDKLGQPNHPSVRKFNSEYEEVQKHLMEQSEKH